MPTPSSRRPLANRPAAATPFTGAVLTGGRSSRMGRDKALVEIGGRPLAAVGLAALRGAGATEVLAVGGDAAALDALGFVTVADRHPGVGPLGAVVTALEHASNDVVVVLSCDLPCVTPAAVRAVLAGLAEGDAAVPEVDGRAQVLLAAYRRSCLPALGGALAAGERALRRALPSLRVNRVELVDPRWARDANRPEDLTGAD